MTSEKALSRKRVTIRHSPDEKFDDFFIELGLHQAISHGLSDDLPKKAAGNRINIYLKQDQYELIYKLQRIHPKLSLSKIVRLAASQGRAACSSVSPS